MLVFLLLPWLMYICFLDCKDKCTRKGLLLSMPFVYNVDHLIVHLTALIDSCKGKKNMLHVYYLQMEIFHNRFLETFFQNFPILCLEGAIALRYGRMGAMSFTSFLASFLGLISGATYTQSIFETENNFHFIPSYTIFALVVKWMLLAVHTLPRITSWILLLGFTRGYVTFYAAVMFTTAYFLLTIIEMVHDKTVGLTKFYGMLTALISPCYPGEKTKNTKLFILLCKILSGIVI